MDVREMMAKHAAACARLARGERTIEDVLGSDDFCLMRVDANKFVCFDCEVVVSHSHTTASRPLIERLHPVELTDDQLHKVREVLEFSGHWDCVHVLDGTMDELQREVDDKLAMAKLRPLLTPEDWQDWQEILRAAFEKAA